MNWRNLIGWDSSWDIWNVEKFKHPWAVLFSLYFLTFGPGYVGTMYLLGSTIDRGTIFAPFLYATLFTLWTYHKEVHSPLHVRF